MKNKKSVPEVIQNLFENNKKLELLRCVRIYRSPRELLYQNSIFLNIEVLWEISYRLETIFQQIWHNISMKYQKLSNVNLTRRKCVNECLLLRMRCQLRNAASKFTI